MNSTIGVGLWSLQQMSFKQHKSTEEIIETVKELGVDAVDIYEDFIPCHPHTNLHKLYQLQKMTQRTGIPVKGCWFCTDLIAASIAGGRQKVVDNFKEYLAVTQALGAEFIAVPYLINVPGLSVEEGIEILLELFEKILPFAEEYQIKIAHELPRAETPKAALKIQKKLKSPYYTLCPDLEAWRKSTEDIPLIHAENPNASEGLSAPVELFKECLPYSPYIHFKLLSFDGEGEEPHFPIREIMTAVNESGIEHHLCIEYEGWIPDIRPDIDCVEGTKQSIELIRKYQRRQEEK